MTRISGALSETELRDYLEAATIPVRLACHTPAGRLWIVSLWFSYRDGTLSCATGAGATLVEYLRVNDDVAFEVSENDPPYRGVRGAGTATLRPDEGKALLRELVERYLGGTDSTLARRLLDPDRAEVRIDVDPDRMYTWDYSQRMADAIDSS